MATNLDTPDRNHDLDVDLRREPVEVVPQCDEGGDHEQDVDVEEELVEGTPDKR